jgi:3-deoxy-D-manno-octulosonic-acid transferase
MPVRLGAIRNRVVIRLIYNLLWPIGLLLFLPGYLVKMLRRGNYRHKFGQRLGIYDVGLRARLAAQKSTWLHAVSVGEVMIALKLAAAIRVLQSEAHFVLTTTTTTGFTFASKNVPDWIEVLYSPLDFWPVMRRAFATIQPAKIVLVEAEVWPNLAAAAHARRIPLALINARLSPRSEKRFRRFRFFVAPTFRLLDLVCVPEAADISRWTAIGVLRENIHVVGSIKYDPEDIHIDLTVPEKVLAECKIDNQRPIILGGSTHAGEEEILGKIFRELRPEFANLFLIIAPRHAERAREIRRAYQDLGLRVALRSRSSKVEPPIDCLVLDSTGELRNWYPVATVVFIGKSLAARGGQNPAEAIVAGKPVVFGQHMENFAAFARSLVERRAALQISSADELKQTILDLLGDAGLRQKLAENARELLNSHRGATVRTAGLINSLASSIVNPKS